MRFNERRFAEEYDRRLIEEGYPGELLDAVIEELNGVKSVIDIGAGTGFFSIPLAELGYKVQAVEPSFEMLRILKSKLTEKSRENITLFQQNWESWNSTICECSICIHSVYPMSDPHTAILNMIQYSGRRVLVIKKPGPSTLTKIVKDHFNIKNDKMDFISLTESILNEKKIKFRVRELFQERETCFTDPYKKAEYFCYYLKLDSSKIDSIINIIRDSSSIQKNQYSFKSSYHDFMFIF